MRYRALKYPPGIFWEVTPLCNHNCVHCFNYWRKDDDETQELNRNGKGIDYEDFVDKILELNPVTVTITGGEPLLIWDKLKPGIERLLKKGCIVSINTNAVLVTDEIAEYLAKRGINLFVSFPCSVESICDEITDVPGSWKKINEGLRILTKHGVRFKCHMVVSTKNIDYIEETALFLKKHYQIKDMSASRVGKPVNASEKFDGYLLEQANIRRLIEESVRITKEHGVTIDASVPYASCSFDTQEEFDMLGGRRYCSAGKASYVIGNDGSVKSCPRDSRIYGNIFEEEFDVIWERMEEWRDGSLYPTECKECKSFSSCFAACRADMLAQNGHCKGVDSTARLNEKPFEPQRSREEPKAYDSNQEFCVAEEMVAVKEKVGYRIAVCGSYTYVTDAAYHYLSTHPQFTVSQMQEALQVKDDVHKILHQLAGIRIIKTI